MKEEIKDIWVEALRSGEYKQTKHYLRLRDSFCCLGVLCDLAVKNGVEVAVDITDNEKYYYDKNSQGIPDSVRNWSGIGARVTGDASEGEMQAPDGEYISFTSGEGKNYDKEDICLSVLNDTYNLNFDQIADVIEKNWNLL